MCQALTVPQSTRTTPAHDQEPGAASVTAAMQTLANALVQVGVLVPSDVRSLAAVAWEGVPSEPPSDLMTQAEVAERLGVSRQTIRNWILQGRLSTRREGKRTLVSFAEAHRVRHPDRAPIAEDQVRDTVARLAENLRGKSWPAIRRAPESRWSQHRTDIEHSMEVLKELLVGGLEQGAAAGLSNQGVAHLRALERPDDPVPELWAILLSAIVQGDETTIDALKVVLGEAWQDAIFELCFAAEQVWQLPMRRYQHEDVFARAYGFFRRAADAGPVVTYSITPGLVIASERHGDSAITKLNFERGLMYPFSGGLSYYEYSEPGAAMALARSRTRPDAGDVYGDSVAVLKRSLMVRHLEMCANPHPFGWWKRRLTRTSPVEQLISVRQPEEDRINPGIDVRYDVLRDGVEVLGQPKDQDDWYMILRAFDFHYVSARYWGDRMQNRVLKDANVALTEDEAEAIAEEEIARLRRISSD